MVGKQSLVALDTQHIHGYVYETDRLQEIRGASAIIDRLNRRIMENIAEKEYGGQKVFANGGMGLFLIPGDAARADAYGQHIQRAYHEQSHGGASVTYVVQELPDGKDAWKDDTRLERNLLRYKLAQKKSEATAIDSPLSHPLLHPCDACGTRYAEYLESSETGDPVSRDNRYCWVCLEKRSEDDRIKSGIFRIIEKSKNVEKPYAWERVIDGLTDEYKKDLPEDTERPPDFNELRGITGGKDYLALIYADGNSMGQLLDELVTLTEVHHAAEAIDDAIFAAMSTAVSEHLPVVPRTRSTPPRFPFDMLLVGGDDAMIVTPASQALDVSCTLAKTFYEETLGRIPGGKECTLSIGVVFAPVKYPFGPLYNLAKETLRYAKKEGTKRQHPDSKYGKETFINFMSVTGSTSLSFEKVYTSLREKHVKDRGRDVTLYATLRPYTVEELEMLQGAIREGRGKRLGRTKLHQVREAVLKMNLTTSVYEGMALLNSWRQEQRDFVTRHVYTLGNYYQQGHREAEKPGTDFPRVTFPWFADGNGAYRTSLLDFTELYDLVAQEED